MEVPVNKDSRCVKAFGAAKGTWATMLLAKMAAFSMVVSVTACVHDETGKLSDARILAEIVTYAEQAYHRDFAGGEGSSYDVTVIAIQDPPNQRGRHISIIHASEPSSNSVWRVPKSKISFALSPSVLDRDEVFVAAVHDLRIEK